MRNAISGCLYVKGLFAIASVFWITASGCGAGLEEDNNHPKLEAPRPTPVEDPLGDSEDNPDQDVRAEVTLQGVDLSRDWVAVRVHPIDPDDPSDAMDPWVGVRLDENQNFEIPLDRWKELSFIRPNLEPPFLVSVSTPTDKNRCERFCAERDEAACEQACLEHREWLSHVEIQTLGELAQIQFNKLGPTQETVEGLPDLDIDFWQSFRSISLQQEFFAEGACAIQEECVDAPGERDLLAFDTLIRNVGQEDIVLGDPSESELFEYDSCHQHYHLEDIVDYDLLRWSELPHANNAFFGFAVDEHPTGILEMIEGRKQGFCMMDRESLVGPGMPVFDCHNQGISAGFGDLYEKELDCQWIDITDHDLDFERGEHWLRLTVNPEKRFEESDFRNNQIIIPIETENILGGAL